MSLGTLFSPGTAHKMGDDQAAVNATLAGNSPYWQTGSLNLGDPNSQGGQYMQQAANAAATPINVNTTAMSADNAKQQAIGSIYANLFQNGGLAEAAATQQGNAAIANNAQGGAAGIANQIANSQKILGQTSQVGTQERAQNGAAGNASDFQVAQTNLAKATMQMAASHAAHVNALNAHAVQNYLGNTQINNQQGLNEAASNARSSMAGINQNVSNSEWGAGMGIGTAALAGAASAGATGINAWQANQGAANPVLGQQIDSANALTLTSPPSQLKAATTSTSPYYPGALVNTYPTSQNAWAIPSSTALIP